MTIPEDILLELSRALYRAIRIHPPQNSPHEGYAFIKEELDELWDEVRKNSSLRSIDRMEAEAVDVAVVAIRFIMDVCRKVDE